MPSDTDIAEGLVKALVKIETLRTERDAARAALQSLRERVEGPAMRVVKTLFAEVGDGDEEPTTIYAGNLDECIAAIRAAVLAEIDRALG
jgi:hypothetical protein